MGRNSCCQCEERLAAVLHSTSFKHALYWLMRNLLKISRVTAGVNIPGLSGVTRLLVGESLGVRDVGHPASVCGKDERQTLGGASPGFPVNFIGFAEHHAAFLNESRTRGSC